MNQVESKALEVVIHFPHPAAAILTVFGIGFVCFIALFIAHDVGKRGFDTEDD